MLVVGIDRTEGLLYSMEGELRGDLFLEGLTFSLPIPRCQDTPHKRSSLIVVIKAFGCQYWPNNFSGKVWVVIGIEVIQ